MARRQKKDMIFPWDPNYYGYVPPYQLCVIEGLIPTNNIDTLEVIDLSRKLIADVKTGYSQNTAPLFGIPPFQSGVLKNHNQFEMYVNELYKHGYTRTIHGLEFYGSGGSSSRNRYLRESVEKLTRHLRSFEEDVVFTVYTYDFSYYHIDPEKRQGLQGYAPILRVFNPDDYRSTESRRYIIKDPQAFGQNRERIFITFEGHPDRKFAGFFRYKNGSDLEMMPVEGD